MSALLKGMFADLNCKLFNLSYNQQRTNELVRNAGWFNAKGEKLGCGDISMADIKNIYNNIQQGDVFIILNEMDTIWDMPSDLDRNEPGIQYLMSKAKWVIAALNDDIYVHNIKEKLARSRQRCYTNDDFTYFEAQRDRMFEDLCYDGFSFTTLKETPITSKVDVGCYYGLDIHHLTNGESWAIGNYTQCRDAAYLKAQEQIWLIDLDKIKAHTHLPTVYYKMIATLAESYEEDSNDVISNMVGMTAVLALAKAHVSDVGVTTILSTYDGVEASSTDIKGLPPNKYAYRID